MKVVTIIGARPQFIKAAVVSRAFKEYAPQVQETIIHTGQQHQKILLYQGGLSKGRGIEFLLEVGQTLSSKDYAIVFMGYGELEEKVKAVSAECNHIYFYPAVPPAEVLQYTASAQSGAQFSYVFLPRSAL